MCSHSAFKGLTNRAVCIICEHLHIPFVDGESAYLKLGLRHVMWIFLKNYFFPHELPVGFCKRVVFQFPCEFDLWSVCFGYAERS